jgi:ribonuclease HI
MRLPAVAEFQKRFGEFLIKTHETFTASGDLAFPDDALSLGAVDGRFVRAESRTTDRPAKSGRRRDKEKRRRHQRKKVDVGALAILPDHLAERFNGRIWLFTDASVKTRGGMAAVLHHPQDAIPIMHGETVARDASHALELKAALFGLEYAQRHYPEEPVVLFSDNRGAIERLARAKHEGLAQDRELQTMVACSGLIGLLPKADFQWIKGHGKCGGNAMADRQARAAADQS